MKVGIFSPYLNTLGGGERYYLTVAEFFLTRGDSVDIFWNGDHNLKKIDQRFGIDISKARIVQDVFFTNTSIFKKLITTAKYDLMFFFSDGSIPATLARKNILHFQVPFKFGNGKTFANKLKFSRFSHVVCNSNFTKKSIDETFGITSEVLYPPVDVENLKPGKKENIILGVGRFFAPMHPKKQEEMVQAFIKMKSDWRLVLIGGVTGNESVKSVQRLKKIANGYNIKIITDSTLDVLKDYYSRAKLFWHAAGFGEDLDNHPERAEHFGMSTVEAMAAGCVPIVFSCGGQREIVEDNGSGCLWTSSQELIFDTRGLMENEDIRESMAKKARLRSQVFSKEKFYENLAKII